MRLQNLGALLAILHDVIFEPFFQCGFGKLLACSLDIIPHNKQPS